MIVDHNLYYDNGWGSGHYSPGTMAIFRKVGSNTYLPTLGDIQSRTHWESNGVEGDPRFMAYNVHDHNLHDESWPSFLLTPASARALDRGTDLPASLKALLDKFAVGDARWGSAYDVGRYEWSNSIQDIYIPVALRSSAP